MTTIKSPANYILDAMEVAAVSKDDVDMFNKVFTRTMGPALHRAVLEAQKGCMRSAFFLEEIIVDKKNWTDLRIDATPERVACRRARSSASGVRIAAYGDSFGPTANEAHARAMCAVMAFVTDHELLDPKNPTTISSVGP